MEILIQSKPNKRLLIILALFALISAGFSAPISSTSRRAATNLNPSTAIDELTVDVQGTVGVDTTGKLDEELSNPASLLHYGLIDTEGFVSNSRSKRYAVQGSKWNVKDLTYKISKYPRLLGKDDVDNEIAKAFALWTAQTDLSITQKQTGQAHINIRFEEGPHGDAIPFDGPGRILGHAYPPMRGDTHFDGAEQWSVTAEDGETNLFSVAVHVLGHALGLVHSQVDSSVMSPYYKGSTTLQLDDDDIKGIQSLYGQKKAVAPITAPEN